MPILQRLTIGRRLTLVLAIIIGLSLLSSALSVLKLQELGRYTRSMVEDQLRIERAISDWRTRASNGVMRALAVARSADSSLVAYFADMTAQSTKETNELQKTVESAMDTPEEKAL